MLMSHVRPLELNPLTNLDRALEIVRGAAQSMRGNVVIWQEGYVLSEAACVCMCVCVCVCVCERDRKKRERE